MLRRMRLTSLMLEQFRSYGRAELVLSDADVHFFVGPNGSGKTNILESISVLALSKSFLGVDEDDIRQWGTDFYRVRAEILRDDGEATNVEVVSQVAPRRQKACFVNDVRNPVTDFVGHVPMVAFLPQDLSLFTGPPAERRRFLDQILCQVSPEYFVAVLEYQKLLRQRNALLKQRSASGVASLSELLRPWDEQLAERAATITLLRLELTETFGLTLRDEIRSLGEAWENIALSYSRTGTSRELPTLRAEILAALTNSAERDVLLQSTGVGPHRDDWQLTVDGHALPSFASRGQQRVAVLALLFLEASYLEVRRGERPLILLDDIFSELDAHHRSRVMESFRGHQVFLTGTEVPTDTEAGAREAMGMALWYVQRGVVSQVAARV